jgi:ElaB/YqjD/DUF883 family membrane-anchored ribosome-binding protein
VSEAGLCWIEDCIMQLRRHITELEQMMEHLLAKMGAEMKAQIGSLVSRMDSQCKEMDVKLENLRPARKKS